MQPDLTHSPYTGNRLTAGVSVEEARGPSGWPGRWFFNPWTGTKRHASDIESDPQCLAVWEPSWGPMPAAPATEVRVMATDEGNLVPAPDEGEHTGGSVNYYKVRVNLPTSGGDAYTAECNDIIESLGLNYAEGNVFKAIWRIAAARNGLKKRGNDEVYDAEKVIFFGQRILTRLRGARR